MGKIAILEDNEKDALKLKSYIQKYGQSRNIMYDISVFSDAVNFFEEYKKMFDVIFLDIEMPYIDGMTAARKIRKLDQKVTLVFTTNLAKYAAQGYEVEAFDYIIKPISYDNFEMKFKRILTNVKNKEENYIILNSKYKVIRIPVSSILYVFVKGHNLIYVTQQGEVAVREKMADAEMRLQKYSFVRINSGCIINMKYISQISGDTIVVGEETLVISRSRKNDFKTKFAIYVGEQY